jgi:hypothetical protein
MPKRIIKRLAKDIDDATTSIAEDLGSIPGVQQLGDAAVTVASKVATPIIRVGSRAVKGIFGRRKKEKKPKVVKKGHGGVVTGKKKSGPRGVGCAKRGHGRALS